MSAPNQLGYNCPRAIQRGASTKLPNFLATTASGAYLFWERASISLPRTAALCAAAALAALALAAVWHSPAHAHGGAPALHKAILPALYQTPAPLPLTPANPLTPPENIPFTQISVGKTHVCALRESGVALCWGGDPQDTGSLDAPTQTAFTQISAGRHFTCGLRQDATIACWGNDSHGQSSPPQGAFSELAAGSNHACAIPMPQTAPPQLICWGSPFPNGAETLPISVPISDIRSGGGFCGLTPQSDMACLSIASRATEITPGPFTQLAVGFGYFCALRENGSAFCEDNWRHYQATQATPPRATKFVQIAAGRYHSCGVTQARALECWGSGRPGAPGERLNAPDGEFVAISIGWENSCALRPDGRAACWHTPNYLPSPPPGGIAKAFGGAIFNTPVDLFPWQNGGIAIVDRSGVIAVHHDRPHALLPQTILDLTDAVVCCQGESGMFSAALDPAFDAFPFLYIWYRTIADNALGEGAPGFVGRLARFRVNNGVAVKKSELTVLEVSQPHQLHLGGAVRFGVDGMLYLGIGDNETQRSAQVLNDLRGKIIRIDVRGANPAQPYRIPPDNPFADVPGARPEIWAYGLRNPWRMAFDPKAPANLFVADVGFQDWEDVSIATAGVNLGWPLCEANACRDDADLANLTPPAVAYGRDRGCAVIGGVTVPWLDDKFIFGDICARRVWLLEPDATPDSAPDSAQAAAQDWQMRQIADLSDLARNILAFGAAEDGGVYILSYDNPILRLDPSLADALPDAPPDE